VIERYQDVEIGRIFSETARMSRWLEVELKVVSALAQTGEIPSQDAAELVANPPVIDDDFVEAVAKREAITNHDLASFVDVIQERYQCESARWIHLGLTSSDVVDTALSLQLQAALVVLIAQVERARKALESVAREHRGTVMLGRTHGMAAEPTTFGSKLAMYALALGRDLVRLRDARDQMAVGKLSGVVGTYSNISPQVEAIALSELGLRPTPATQVIARDRHAQVVYALASTAATIESCAIEFRHLARTEVGEVREAFGEGQKGSSAMPHKRNPILSERLCGMARLARGYLTPALEDVALWHERDISHSSVERVMFPDLFHIVTYMATHFGDLVATLVVFPEVMKKNLDATKGLIYSQSVLLSLVRAGMPRDEAYRIVQRATSVSLMAGTQFADALVADPQFPLSREELAQVCGIERLIARTSHVFEVLDRNEPEGD